MVDQSKSTGGFKVPAAPKRSAPLAPPPLKYDEPATAVPPSAEFTLEVIKAGTLLETRTIKPTTQTYFVFGRLPNCDFSMEHESISRYHAILQFYQNDLVKLIDLNSSHGTFVNKRQITTYELQSGDQIRFGMSSRIWIFNSPSQDEQQPENNSAASPPLYKNKDRKLRKFLRKHLDNDDYTWTTTKVDNQYCCSIVIEAFKDQDDNSLAICYTSSSKEESEQMAAHKMLLLLDHHGFLNINQTTRNQYESSEDEYYDHTIQSALKEPEVETSDSLKRKIELVILDIAKAQHELAQIKHVGSVSTELDELDRYMADLNQKEQQQLQSQLIKQIVDLQAHKAKLESLLQIADPGSEIASESDNRTVQRTQDSTSPKEPPAAQSPSANINTLAANPNNGAGKDIPAPKRKRVYGPTRKELEQQHTTVKPNNIVSNEEDSSSTWQPPAGQTGDGKTSLNDKYGY
ncbi:hypothetical protein IWW36_001238 [Coemansia brasiliensis]|uniref:FHA domain-containing protein n=1 Tax=Coemansia brasiliensis TaxID=2650707 RepID=A0A9W8I9H3_9FUNG|nr:hypothetical protein IWW36_001238 [Coemansia brasiliensis]